MPAAVQTDNIAKQYGIEAVPENVLRLGRLVSSQGANMDQVAKLICQDSGLTARLLRAANPKSESEADYRITTVEAALQRSGMGSALFLAMHGPIECAVRKTFLTMVGIELNPRAGTVVPSWGEHLLCEIAFKGKASGSAALRLATRAALQIAARVLGQPPAEVDDVATIADVVGELCNMVVGNFKSNLCDAGLHCILSTPVLTWTADRQVRAASGSLAERIVFHAPDLDVLMDLHVNPWDE